MDTGSTYGHGNAAYAHVGTQPLAHAGKLPEEAHGNGIFPLVEQGGHHVVHVGACADEEEDDEQEGLEVEEGRLCSRATSASKSAFQGEKILE